MRQTKKWNELTKNERQAVMEFAVTVGKAEKKESLDVILPVLEREIKRLDSAQRYHGAMPLLFRDNLGISASIEIANGRYVCTDIVGRGESEPTTVICALLCQAHFSFNESSISPTHFTMLVKLLNEMEPRELSSGMLAYNKPRRIHKDVMQWY